MFGSAPTVHALSCASSINRAVSIYKIDFPFAATPDLEVAYGLPAVNQLYGTGICEGRTFGIASPPQGYQFTVRHPQEHKIFTISEESIRAD